MRDLRGGLVRTTVGCFLAGTVLLTGCAEKQEASTSLPTTQPAPTTEALPPLGPADMPMPDEAREQTAAGAEAFVRYYFALINHTSATLDPSSLRQLSVGCDDCARIADNAQQNAEAGNRYDGGRITVTEVAPPLVRDERADMAIRVDQSKLTVRDGAGTPLAEESSEAYSGLPGSVSLAWDSDVDSWLMTYMVFG